MPKNSSAGSPKTAARPRRDECGPLGRRLRRIRTRPRPHHSSAPTSRPSRQSIFPPRGLGADRPESAKPPSPKPCSRSAQTPFSSTRTKRPRVLSSKRPRCEATRPTRLTALHTTGKSSVPSNMPAPSPQLAPTSSVPAKSSSSAALVPNWVWTPSGKT